MSNFNDDDVNRTWALKHKLLDEIKDRSKEIPGLSIFLTQAILTGGAFTSLWHNEDVNDYDLYLADDTTVKQFVRYVLANQSDIQTHVKEISPKYMETMVEGKLVTANAVTFKNKLQVITIMNRSHRQNFDFVHCMPYIDLDGGKMYMSQTQLNSIKTKQLVPNPNGKLVQHRLEKFKNKGWTI